MKVRYKLTGTEVDASHFNVHALAEVLTGDDSTYISDLDVFVNGVWKDMREAFKDRDIIPDNYNTFFGIPRNGDARLFKLSEPVAYDYDWENDIHKSQSKYVVVSAANVAFSGPGTYIFPANEEGKVVHWGELEGSFKGGLDHERALRNAGFEVQR